MTSDFYRRYGKRAFDLGLVLLTAPVWVPLALLVAAFVRLRLGKPVFFQQRRAGRNGEIFSILKFRTMTDQCDAQGTLLQDAERLTPAGKFLRRTSLDELPELFQVLSGELSLVGPRPLLVDYLPLYSEEQMRRHEAKPGITGWAQVNGRNAISWPEKFSFDVWYVDNLSLRLDIKILIITVTQLFHPKGVNSQTSATMERFSGGTKNKNNAKP